MITLDQVLSGRNILRAIKQVVSNKGAPGIDNPLDRKSVV